MRQEINEVNYSSIYDAVTAVTTKTTGGGSSPKIL